MQEIFAVDLIVIVGPTGSGNSKMIKDYFESALRVDPIVSVYGCLS